MMDKKHGNSTLRINRPIESPTKHTKPLNTSKTVSVAAVFKRQIHEGKNGNSHKKVVEDDSLAEMRSAKSLSSSHSPKKATSRVSKRRSERHPLAVAFKATSDDYRRHLYNTATVKIDETLKGLLHRLHESTLQDVPTANNHDPKASPLKLSAPVKYERIAKKLYQPISQYRLSLSRTNAQGKKEYVQATLENRMARYEEHITQHRKELAVLQKEWETVVGEIWKLGVICLGNSMMEKLLFANKDTPDLSSSPSQAAEVTSPLFVAEHGSTPPRKSRTDKKHVSFKNVNVGDKDEIASTPHIPSFLMQPSKLRGRPIPDVEPVARQDVKELETMISGLGKKQVEELRKIEKDHKDYWRKKNAALASALKDD